MISLKYKKILFKLSGEALQGSLGYGIDPEITQAMAEELKEIHSLGVSISIVVGGGNIFRGMKGAAKGMDRASADYMGMLATVMNALALQEAIEKLGVQTRVQSAINMSEISEPYIRRKAIRHLEKKRIVIFGAGTGNPFFTTDTAAALRANEMGVDILLKGTKVDGIYDKDPVKFSDATKFDSISFDDALKKDIKVMDSTAFSLCREHKMPIIVFKLGGKDNLKNIVLGKDVGTKVS